MGTLVPPAWLRSSYPDALVLFKTTRPAWGSPGVRYKIVFKTPR